MPNPDALLLKKFFFDGWFVSEWFIDSIELHTVPQISVTDYKSYFKMYMKEKLKDLYYYNDLIRILPKQLIDISLKLSF